jgi:NADH:ubiquinone oxidoreductase subunit 6 (subunit J)
LDTLHSVLFYAFAAVTVAGGLATALLGARSRALGLGLVAIGVAGLLGDLDAGFAALVTLVALSACALLILKLPAPAAEEAIGLDRQLGAALSGLAFLALAYVAFKGSYFGGGSPSGFLNSAALGRLLFARDALAVEALAAAFLVALAGGRRLLRERRR